MNNKLNISKGILIGAACGDSLGAPLEFLPPRDTNNFVTEMTGGGVLKWQPGEPTDDTIMAISIMEMYEKYGCYNYDFIVNKWIDWLDTKPKDIGNWTHKVLVHLKHKKSDATKLWMSGGKQDAGNGAIMRCMPTAIARFNNLNILVDETISLANITHPDPRCTISCVVINLLLAYSFLGSSKEDAYKKIINQIKDIGNDEIINAVTEAQYLEWGDLENSGYTIDTMKCAIWAWLKNDSFEDGLIKIINRGNDADSVGAVAGALLGAYHGYDSIPERWTKKLKVKSELLKFSEILLKKS